MVMYVYPFLVGVLHRNGKLRETTSWALVEYLGAIDQDIARNPEKNGFAWEAWDEQQRQKVRKATPLIKSEPVVPEQHPQGLLREDINTTKERLMAMDASELLSKVNDSKPLVDPSVATTVPPNYGFFRWIHGADAEKQFCENLKQLDSRSPAPFACPVRRGRMEICTLGVDPWILSLAQAIEDGEAQPDLDQEEENAVCSKEDTHIPKKQEAVMAKEEHHPPINDSAFAEYLMAECMRLREEKDELYRELLDEKERTREIQINVEREKQRLMADHHRIMGEVEREKSQFSIVCLQDFLREQGKHHQSRKDEIQEKLDAACSKLDEIRDAQQAQKDTPTHNCPAPVTPPQEDPLDKGLKITNRTLTAAQIIWKIAQLLLAASAVGGVVTCASMMLR